jgi:hypothetical protein
MLYEISEGELFEQLSLQVYTNKPEQDCLIHTFDIAQRSTYQGSTARARSTRSQFTSKKLH